MRAEFPHPALGGSPIDFVAGGAPPTALIEFKYPREPNIKNAARTMVLGEVLKDLYRLAAYPGDVTRLFVYVETSAMRQYMAGVDRRHGLDLDTEAVWLRSAAATGLPATAARIIGELAAHDVGARRLVAVEVDEQLRLSVYQVDALGAPATATAEEQVVEDAATPSDQPLQAPWIPGREPDARPTEAGWPAPKEGARREVLAAARAVVVHSGRETFAPAEVIAELSRRRSGYAEATIRTMIVSHMCRNAPDHASVVYDDFERVDRATYRFVQH